MELIVTLAPVPREMVSRVAQAVAERHGATDVQVFERFCRMACRIEGASALAALRADPDVAFVREGTEMRALG